MSLKAKTLLEFGPFRLDTGERTLWREGQPVPLTIKALETLIVLVENSGRLVEKEHLLKAVWPDTFVEEGNLAVQISLLRKTLRDEGLIETVPRRGYRFTGAVSPYNEKPPPTPANRRRFAAIAAAGLAGLSAIFVYRSRQKAPLFRSVAILPFQMLQAAPEEESLGLGLADAVIMKLGRARNCIVRPTSAVRQFDKPSRDPVAAGVALGVDAVLDASIQRSGDRLRLNAQLIRVSDGQHIWTESFDVQSAGLFALEDDLASRFARSLLGETLPGPRYQPKPEAYRLYALGRFHRNRWNLAGQRKAIEYFQQAIALDPGFAAAHAMMADSWALQGYLFGMPPREAFPQAEAAARKAISLDDQASEAHHALGVVQLFFNWNWPEAGQHLRRALELDPNNPDSLQVFGVLRTVQRKNAEGIAALKQALTVDPASQWRHVGMSFQYACAGALPEAIAESIKANELDPGLAAPYLDLFNLLMVQGRHGDAVDWYLRLLARPSATNPGLAREMKVPFEKGGIKEFLQARLALAEKAGTGNPMPRAQLLTYLGEFDEAMRWLEKAEEQRHSQVIFANQHPMYAPLRSHPRFQQLVKRNGL